MAFVAKYEGLRTMREMQLGENPHREVNVADLMNMEQEKT